MSTPAQVTANQQNAHKSTGPKTLEGKAAASKNSTKHGLSSAFAVLTHEDQDEFDTLLINLREEHLPSTEHQAFLVEQLAKTQWLLARAQRLEAAAFDHLAGAPHDPDDADSAIIAKMFETNPNPLLTLQRYAANAERSYYKAWRELKAAKQLQNEADYVRHLDHPRAAVTERFAQAPAPDHPAYGPSPVLTQYGHLPQMTKQTQNVRDAARNGDGSMAY
jgi:hypothetical protein